MNNTILGVFFRSIIVLVVLFFIEKLVGKKQVGQLNLFDYIIGITIGSVAADISLDLEKNFLDGIVSLLVFGGMGYFVSVMSLHSIKLRRFFSGTPTVVIEDGKIIESGLKKVKFDINDLMEEMRNSGYFDINEIAYAVMETNGKVSFLPKDYYKSVTKGDMNLKIIPSNLVANIIIDGKVMDNNLKAMKKDIKWLKHELKILGFDISEILLATLDFNDKVTVYKKDIDSCYDTIFE